jgi:hypothetical protein
MVTITGWVALFFALETSTSIGLKPFPKGELDLSTRASIGGGRDFQTVTDGDRSLRGRTKPKKAVLYRGTESPVAPRLMDSPSSEDWNQPLPVSRS